MGSHKIDVFYYMHQHLKYFANIDLKLPFEAETNSKYPTLYCPTNAHNVKKRSY